jgi:3'-phosphoadenosine 5'-phosphosulfate sulfotransferase (PAPS reductase)/FAD synthetase
LKFYQLSFTAIAVPTCYALEQMNELQMNTWIVGLYLGLSGTVTLIAASQAFKNTVGFIYTSYENPDKLKFSYVDFWGKRRDSEVTFNEVMPFTELPKGFTDKVFTRLQFYDSKMPELKLVHKFGGITDLEEFTRVFGSTD